MKTALKKNQKLLAPPQERIANDDPKLIETMSVGDTSHQGDLIIVAIGVMPKSARPRANRQLADGDTQGSRHILLRGDVFDADAAEIAALIRKANGCDVGLEYIGPVFVSPKEPTAEDLDHPEHGSQGFPDGMVCAVVYQRNLDSEERERRTRD